MEIGTETEAGIRTLLHACVEAEIEHAVPIDDFETKVESGQMIEATRKTGLLLGLELGRRLGGAR